MKHQILLTGAGGFVRKHVLRALSEANCAIRAVVRTGDRRCICSGVSKTMRQLAEQIADEYGRRDLLKFGARPGNLVDRPCGVR